MLPRLSCCVNSGQQSNGMPWSYRGLEVESEWRKSDFIFKKKRRKRAAGGGARRRGADVGEVADASFLFMNALMMNQQWRRKQMALILNTSLL